MELRRVSLGTLAHSSDETHEATEKHQSGLSAAGLELPVS